MVVTTTVLEAVQLLAPITVTVYVPGAVTVIMLVVELFDHIYVPPPVAVNTADGLVHVSGPLPVAATAGGVVLCVTVKDEVAVQPLVVTVTVYTPAAVTVLEAAVPPPLHV